VTAGVSQKHGCKKILFGGKGLLFFIVEQQNMQQISKSGRKSAESVTTVR
jgi:hypothetical protein